MSVLEKIDFKNKCDFLIIGGGTAALTAAQYGARSNLSTIVIEAESGGQALMIDKLENYPGVFPSVPGFSLMQTMKNQAETFGARFVYGSVVSIDKMEGYFIVKTKTETYASIAVLLATGAEHRKLGIPGEEEFIGKGVSYCAACDGPFFSGKRIAVIGGGDAACDEANYLSKLSDKVCLFHRRSEFRAQAAVAERVMNNSNIKVYFNHVPVRIEGNGKVEAVVFTNTETGSEVKYEVDAVFIFVGMVPKTSLAEMAQTDKNGYIITDENMETSIPGLFCAGDLRSKPFRQIITAAADGAYAAHGVQQYVSSLSK